MRKLLLSLIYVKIHAIKNKIKKMLKIRNFITFINKFKVFFFNLKLHISLA